MDVILYNRRVDNGGHIIQQKSGLWTLYYTTEEWIMDIILYNRRVDNGRYIIQQKSG